MDTSLKWCSTRPLWQTKTVEGRLPIIHIGYGRDVLTTKAVVWINLPGLWDNKLAVLHLARLGDIGFGLTATYVMLINALIHIAAATAALFTSGPKLSRLIPCDTHGNGDQHPRMLKAEAIAIGARTDLREPLVMESLPPATLQDNAADCRASQLGLIG
jgi:hypothetical protein